MFKYFANTVCSLFSFEAYDAYVMPQLPEAIEVSLYLSLIYSSLLLFIVALSTSTGMILSKNKSAINKMNKSVVNKINKQLISLKQVISSKLKKHVVSDGHNLAQKGKPPELDGRVITYDSFLSKQLQEPMGFRAFMRAQMKNLSEHQKARRRAYGYSDDCCDKTKGKTIVSQLSLVEKLKTSSLNSPSIKPHSLVELIRCAGKAQGVSLHPFKFSLFSQ